MPVESRYARRPRPAAAWPGLAPPAACPDKPVMPGAGVYEKASDGELISLSANGDRQAFAAIVARHGRFALRVALRLAPDPVAAEDVVQEAMVRAWSRARHFDERRARFTTWLYRIVVNLCIDQLRRAPPQPALDDVDPVDPAAPADEMLEASERHAAVLAALGDLPLRQRAAITLVYDEGLSGAEAARILGLSTKAVERLLARGRASLRQRLLPLHDGKES
jgi:RNA polymerase sigma-70 factor (ECF subfamily)